MAKSFTNRTNSRYRDHVGSQYPGSGSEDITKLNFNSFSGTDIQCFFFGDNLSYVKADIASSTALSALEKHTLVERASQSRQAVSPFGELQTLTVSSARSFGPVRRLGENRAVEYKGGARTIAGTLVFGLLNRDVFSDYMRDVIPGAQADNWRGPDFVDELPPFNILIRGGNEYGAMASAMLIGVRVTNFGTTFSVDDLFTEATYSYVAEHYIPFVEDWRKTLSNFDQTINRSFTSALSEKVYRERKLIVGRGGVGTRDDKLIAHLLAKIPDNLRQKVIDTFGRDRLLGWSMGELDSTAWQLTINGNVLFRPIDGWPGDGYAFDLGSGKLLNH